MTSAVSRAMLLLALAALAACKGGGRSGAATSLAIPAAPEPPGDQPAFPLAAHIDQERVRSGAIAFGELFALGDELFEARFNALDGVGALLRPDQSPLVSRFSRVPPGGGRVTGPNGQSCEACHNSPFGTAAGEASANVHQDPAGAGVPPFNVRNTPSLFGDGAIQRLAEEMTEELLAIRAAAAAAATSGGPPVTRALAAKGIGFGSITATRAVDGTLSFDTSAVEGISADLVLRPFGWKGDVPTLRSFSRGAARNELGMESDELVAKLGLGVDPDGDGVEGELSIGDITAMTVYVAAQEAPTTSGALAERGLIAPLGRDFAAAAALGESLFGATGCARCHVSELVLADPVFREPSSAAGGSFRDTTMDPTSTGLDPAQPARFHLGREGDPPRPPIHSSGGLSLRLFGDLKRHDMGAALADAQATAVQTADGPQLSIGGVAQTVPAREFLTPELWGAGSTGPWLHDGRAGTLDEAIRAHGIDGSPAEKATNGSEAQAERDAYLALSESERQAAVTFLRTLVLFDFEAGGE